MQPFLSPKEMRYLGLGFPRKKLWVRDWCAGSLLEHPWEQHLLREVEKQEEAEWDFVMWCCCDKVLSRTLRSFRAGMALKNCPKLRQSARPLYCFLDHPRKRCDLGQRGSHQLGAILRMELNIWQFGWLGANTFDGRFGHHSSHHWGWKCKSTWELFSTDTKEWMAHTRVLCIRSG